MPHNIIFVVIVFSIYAFITWLILYQVEIRLKFYAKLKCRFGYHKRVSQKLGKTVRELHCVHCGKRKEHPHLQLLEGGKKDLGIKFKW